MLEFTAVSLDLHDFYMVNTGSSSNKNQERIKQVTGKNKNQARRNYGNY